MSNIRPDVRRFNARFDGFCHACGTRHVEAGQPVVWHGRGQGSSHEGCYDRAVEAEKKAREMPLFADHGNLDEALLAIMECSEGYAPKADMVEDMVKVSLRHGSFEHAVTVARTLRDADLHTLTCRAEDELRPVYHAAHDCLTQRDYKAFCWCNDGEIFVS